MASTPTCHQTALSRITNDSVSNTTTPSLSLFLPPTPLAASAQSPGLAPLHLPNFWLLVFLKAKSKSRALSLFPRVITSVCNQLYVNDSQINISTQPFPLYSLYRHSTVHLIWGMFHKQLKLNVSRTEFEMLPSSYPILLPIFPISINTLPSIQLLRRET